MGNCCVPDDNEDYARRRFDPNEDVINALNKEYCTLFNNGQFEDLANMYTADAVLIPATHNQFVPQSQMATWFQEYPYKYLNRTLNVIQLVGDSTIYEIGTATNSQDPEDDELESALYFTMWAKDDDNANWKVSVDIMGIFDPTGSTQATSNIIGQSTVDSIVFEEIKKLDQQYCSHYNNHEWTELVDIFTEDTVVIPHDHNSFVQQAGNALGKWFKSASSIVTNLSLEPLLVVESSDGMTRHEICKDTKLFKEKHEESAIYNRWAKQQDGTWEISTQVMEIGSVPEIR